ncbi:hypothetical protein AAFF_G00212630 [Aldrovandia affinis]|uniref:Uncharacterized protein n=1 Tax=Aldrovandia affinis TaxID=143900 RepID=A0AAD7RH03_9TELE|nr:hypothetical protein AAFF_G00212630 [Aldrovandia affinis]
MRSTTGLKISSSKPDEEGEDCDSQEPTVNCAADLSTEPNSEQRGGRLLSRHREELGEILMPRINLASAAARSGRRAGRPRRLRDRDQTRRAPRCVGGAAL